MVGKEYEGQAIGGEFRLLRFLGGGGASGVFLAVQPGGEPARVALKLVRADSAAAQRAKESWNAAARLSHPHLIRLLRTGHCRIGDTDFLYAAMEYAEENLSDVLLARPLTTAETREVLTPVLDALSYLHGQGYVHGGVKPANILATRDQLKLACDSIVQVGGRLPRGVRPEPYDPPEARTLGAAPAADVWSVGVTLVETLTQQVPEWQGQEQERPQLPKKLPEPFGEIAYRTLVRDPARRWRVPEIRACTGAREVTASAANSPSRRRLPWLLIGSGVALLAAFGGYRLLVRGSRSESAVAPAEEQPASAGPAPQQRRPSPSGPSTQPVAPAAAPEEPAPEATASEEGIVTRVMPDVPRAAQDTIQGSFGLEIRVTVNPAGDVTDAALLSPGPSRYFAALALDAARQWKFAPVSAEAGAGRREWMLQFRFDRFATRVTASPIPR